MDYKNNCMDWNDTIENDGAEFVLLEDGDYNFTVTGFERGRFPGSAKIPECNKATLNLSVETPEGTANIKCDLILYRSLEWRISSFFRCIGQKKHGERLQMNWDKVVGAKGRARFKKRSYISKDGTEKFANDVDHFYDYDDGFFPETAWVKDAEKAPEAAAPTQPSWQQGSF